MGDEAFKRRLGALIIMARNNFVLLLKSFITNGLKFKSHLEAKFKCVCVTMRFLVMSLFSRDYIKTEIC